MKKIIFINIILISFLFPKPVLLSDIEKVASNFLNQRSFKVKEPISSQNLFEYPVQFVLLKNVSVCPQL